MSPATRALLAIVCLAALAFCSFGFAATFEPLEPGTQLAWRTGYSVAALLLLALLFKTALPRRRR